MVLALAATLGAHWAALQTLAWTTMLAANLSGENFSAAVSKTFDGAHPCCLCKAIAAGKKSERKNEINLPSHKLEFLASSEKIVLLSPSVTFLPLKNFHADSILQKPPVPPPRDRFVGIPV